MSIEDIRITLRKVEYLAKKNNWKEMRQEDLEAFETFFAILDDYERQKEKMEQAIARMEEMAAKHDRIAARMTDITEKHNHIAASNSARYCVKMLRDETK